MKTEEKLSELLKEAEDHPLMKQILAEKADQVLRDRLLAAARLRAASEAAASVIPELRDKVDALVADLAAYDKGRTVIVDKLQAARGELMGESIRQDLEGSHARADLLGNYDPRIDEAITFFRDRFDGLRGKPITEQKRRGKRNLFKETREMSIFSNAAAVKSALAFCRAAIDELEKMKLLAVPDMDRIEKLKKGIPDADKLSEGRQEKLMEKGPDMGFLAKVEAERDARVNRLLSRKHPGVPEWK